MEPFRYVRVQDNQAAIRAAGINEAKFIAGGTNMLDLMKLNIETPKQVVDINKLSLYKIEELQNGGIRIGALVKNSDLAYHPTILKNYPVIIGSYTFRSVATIKKYGHYRRQPDAAYALPLFLQHRFCLQQTCAGFRLCRNRGL